jgi:DNA invertase Pin-like site-specific DNA recombinase
MTNKKDEVMSERTKHHLKKAKERGVVLGNPNLEEVRPLAHEAKKRNADVFAMNFGPVIYELKSDGKSLQKIADDLDSIGLATRQGGKWWPTTVKNCLDRYIQLMEEE